MEFWGPDKCSCHWTHHQTPNEGSPSSNNAICSVDLQLVCPVSHVPHKHRYHTGPGFVGGESDKSYFPSVHPGRGKVQQRAHLLLCLKPHYTTFWCNKNGIRRKLSENFGPVYPENLWGLQCFKPKAQNSKCCVVFRTEDSFTCYCLVQQRFTPNINII